MRFGGSADAVLYVARNYLFWHVERHAGAAAGDIAAAATSAEATRRAILNARTNQNFNRPRAGLFFSSEVRAGIALERSTPLHVDKHKGGVEAV